MTMYVYGPSEPNANPTAPSVDMNAAPLSVGDSSIRGRCGGCNICPAIWRLEVPMADEDFSLLVGTFYLRRMPYQAIRGGDVYNYKSTLCYFSQIAGEPIPRASQEEGDTGVYWELLFEQVDNYLAWHLYTPMFGDGFHFSRSYYRFNHGFSNWRCAGQNTLDFVNRAAEFGLSGAPPRLTIEPFYA